MFSKQIINGLKRILEELKAGGQTPGLIADLTPQEPYTWRQPRLVSDAAATVVDRRALVSR